MDKTSFNDRNDKIAAVKETAQEVFWSIYNEVARYIVNDTKLSGDLASLQTVLLNSTSRTALLSASPGKVVMPDLTAVIGPYMGQIYNDVQKAQQQENKAHDKATASAKDQTRSDDDGDDDDGPDATAGLLLTPSANRDGWLHNLFHRNKNDVTDQADHDNAAQIVAAADNDDEITVSPRRDFADAAAVSTMRTISPNPERRDVFNSLLSFANDELSAPRPTFGRVPERDMFGIVNSRVGSRAAAAIEQLNIAA